MFSAESITSRKRNIFGDNESTYHYENYSKSYVFRYFSGQYRTFFILFFSLLSDCFRLFVSECEFLAIILFQIVFLKIEFLSLLTFFLTDSLITYRSKISFSCTAFQYPSTIGTDSVSVKNNEQIASAVHTTFSVTSQINCHY